MRPFREDDKPMLVFEVKEMTSSRVAGFVSRAVLALDPGAAVRVDATVRRLDIEPSTSDADDVARALMSAGYTPTLVERAADSPFAWADNRDPEPGSDAVAGVSRSRSLLPPEALGPLTP